MGGGKPPTTTTVNQNTSNLPEYAKPYYTSMMGKAQALTSTPYTPYGGNRIAGFTPQQMQTQQNIMAQQVPGQFGTATNMAQQAGLGALAAGRYDPTQFNTQQVSGPELNYFQMGGPQEFGNEQAQQYMSPYIQNVLDIQKQQALRDAQQGQLTQNLGAARQGTYGGARQLLATTERERNLGNQMGQIEATGLQNAYQSAQQQFNTQQALSQAAAQQNLSAALGVQNTGSEYEMRAALANQTQNLESQRLGEASRQFGATQGLNALAQANQSAQTLGNLGVSQQQAQQALYGQQQQTAAQTQALQQQYYDQMYQDFLRQQNYPMEQLQQYSSLLHGVPVGNSGTSTQTTTGTAPSIGAQLMGTGLTALSAYNMVK